MKTVFPRRSGFTLIELLVVIAIISILAAILFPVFASAREKARQITCSSNEKEIGVAILGYVQDYDERLPPVNLAIDPTDPNSGNYQWQYLVNSYIKSQTKIESVANGSDAHVAGGAWASVFACPDWDKTNTAFDPAANVAAPPIEARSYGINQNYATPQHVTAPTVAVPPATLAQLKAPAQLVLVAEIRGNFAGTTGNDTSTPAANIGSGGAWAQYVEGRVRHSGGSNYLFADGHVKWVHAPSPNRQADGQTPTVSTTGVVYSQQSYPSASGWFLEDPNS